jgi:hypothetical protein
MKFAAATIILLSALAAAPPASAQTYDPRYPVCIQVFGEQIGERIDCIFTSIPQCQATASGLPAMCMVNPYFANAGEYPRPHRSRSR